MDEEDDDYWSGKSTKRRKNIFDDDEPSLPVTSAEKNRGSDNNYSLDSKLREMGLGDEPDVGSSSTSKRPPSVRGTVNASRPPAAAPTRPRAVTTTNGSVRYSKTGVAETDNVSLSSTNSSQHSSELSHRRSASDASGKTKLPGGSPSASTISAGSASSIDEAVRRNSQPSHAETARLSAQIKSLERKIQSLNRSRWTPLPVADTISRIITGERYSLEPYKLLKDKLTLLDSVVGYHDGNAILAVVVFLKKTLNKSLFYEELRKRPEAVSQYLAFLKTQKNDDVAREMTNLGRSEDASMWRFKEATEKSGAEERQKAVLHCYSLAGRGIEGREFEADMMNEYGKLLYKQNQIEPADARAQAEGRPPFRDFPRKASLYFQPLITTLFYCCLYHYGDPETIISSPDSLKRDFKMSEKQFLYTALRSRSKRRDWASIEALFTAKNWRGRAKFKAPMKFEKVVEVLASMKAEHDILDKYLRLVEDIDVRLQLAQRYECHLVVIDIFVELKDRQKLESYRDVVRSKPPENRIDIILRNSSIKWKN